jgi:hypothetical protein
MSEDTLRFQFVRFAVVVALLVCFAVNAAGLA